MTKKVDADLRQSVIALHYAGQGRAAIAKTLKLNETKVHRILRQANIARPAHVTRSQLAGNPARADAALRKF
jgi:DNA-binding transcriptional regulator LsrR (DeoR family)